MKYRILEKGEIIQAGDEVDACVDAWRDDPVWVPAPQHTIGTPASDPAFVSHAIYRRPLVGDS
jgi:hypothetical protein